ncbi:MAG TPA: efflux RND transporter periplasmic adaptor subunit [Candidatus Paceibacterota bacterium]|nr:efflux RND transporter periplasmic adaptor subunit [Candidatus Pacearchaeota archaeon]HRZ50434.1 efflux RND transporter periplasmic adaptor subunit [Candidatus Paceibacterota bacterium]HSA36155.1 efflux RND transporter periplasmic adaptor subunit [Candidatus Paceibacterota bacterium]
MPNPIKKLFSRNKLIFFFIILAVGAYYIYKAFNPQAASVSYATAVAETGTLVQSVSGTGQINALSQVDLKSKVAGDVVSVNVATGAIVKKGDAIAVIDDADARQSLKDAKTALETAKLSLEEMLESADELTVMQAEDALTTAKEAKGDAEDALERAYEDGFNDVGNVFLDLPDIMIGLQNIIQGSDSTVVQSSANYLEYYYNAVRTYKEAPSYYHNASNAYAKARQAYDQNMIHYKTANRFSDKDTIKSLINETYDTTKLISDAAKNIASMIQFYQDEMSANNMAAQSFSETHIANLSSYSSKANSHLATLLSDKNEIGDAITEISGSDRMVKEKTLALNDIMAGADELDIRAQRIVVEQKETALDEAMKELENCTIRAPFDGKISSVSVSAGDTLSLNGAVASIITDSQVANIALNEVDIAKVRNGQKATLTFDAIEDLSLTGKVVEIDTVGTVSAGVVSYGVKIGLDGQNEQVKPGMSVTAAIIIQAKQNVVMVPNTAVKSSSGIGNYVEFMLNGSLTPTRQTVETGLSNDEYTEIISGVNEGDVVVTGSSVSSFKPSSKNDAGGFNIFGGGIRGR